MKTNHKETYWSQRVENYEDQQEFVVGKEVLRLAMEELESEAAFSHVLELGCGTGLFTQILAKKAQQLTATDYSDEMIASAQNLREYPKHVSFISENAMELSFDNGQFDEVFMANLIHIVSDPEKVIAESWRVLKPGGRLIITSFTMDEMKFTAKLKMVFRYLKSFGKISDEARKVKTSKRSVEEMLVRKQFEIQKSLLLGSHTKAMYLLATKKNNLP